MAAYRCIIASDIPCLPNHVDCTSSMPRPKDLGRVLGPSPSPGVKFAGESVCLCWSWTNCMERQHPCATRTKLEKHAVARDEIFNWNKQEFITSIKVNKAAPIDYPHRIKVKTATFVPSPNLLHGMPRPRQGVCWQMRAHRLVVCASLRHLSPSPLTFSRSVPFLELSPT